MANLNIGDEAPDFTLPGNGARAISLASFRGKPLVLYFYPKDDTTACTTEAISFSHLKPEFEKLGAAVVGVSADSVKKHDNFVSKRELTISLGSDEDTAVSQLYGVWKEKSMYGKTYMGIERTTFLIDAEGRVAKIWPKVKVAGHAEDVLAAARAL
ncbi:thioredoxin-dependent thiol peroxidase [Aliirhizobium smilacinae]|uniref:thioredoxin-dependent peroxiredoxin n=1 Tax=Aliirhizobium smilacinae TaxID=1395944 RepID=A0A5C4XFF9_9HYPH|nr:thioredoxin-dependent thiol peroxidase [Rhizobium smilacinae]TNM62019.1 thioredoxin-dependent thiol peroxidase [Rhizobium smilacinae]